MTEQSDNLNEQLSAFLDGELPQAEAAELERRLAADHALRLELEELAEVKRLVGQLPRATAPASIKAAIHDQLERRSLLQSPADPPVGLWGRTARLAAAAAIFLVVTTASYIVQNSMRQPPGPELTAESGGIDRSPDSPMAKLAAGEQFVQFRGGWGEAEDLRRTEAPAIDLPVERQPGGPPALAVARDFESVSAAKSLGGAQVAAGPLRSAAPLASRFGQANTITAGEVQELCFESEPVVLNVPVADATRQQAVVDRLRKTLSKSGAVPVEQLDAKTQLTANDHQFYMQGQKSRNFAERPGVSQEQIVVRVRREVAEKLVGQANRDSAGRADIELRGISAEADAVEVRQQLTQARALDEAARGRASGGGHGYDAARGPATAPAAAAPTVVAAEPVPSRQDGRDAASPATDDAPASGTPAPTGVAANDTATGPTPPAPPAPRPAALPAEPTPAAPMRSVEPADGDQVGQRAARRGEPLADGAVSEPQAGRPATRPSDDPDTSAPPAAAMREQRAEGLAVPSPRQLHTEGSADRAGDAGWVNLVINVYVPAADADSSEDATRN